MVFWVIPVMLNYGFRTKPDIDNDKTDTSIRTKMIHSKKAGAKARVSAIEPLISHLIGVTKKIESVIFNF